ncbi:hypothetical protein [Runella sp.]|uniref:hypothetical protein n=1 Tax=Runella sp. TaxID=1960881 RepID=UPI003D13C32C
MIGNPVGLEVNKWRSYADWKLLVFLLLFLNVKLAVKIPTIVILYLWQFNFKFGFSVKNSRLPLFYLLIIPISLAGLFMSQNHRSPNYTVVFSTGIFFWLLCLLAIHQVKLSVEKHNSAIIHQTLGLFFGINAAISACNLLIIIVETGEINPYLYQGEFQKYFISTGDYIKGVTFDTSTTNAVINAMGVVYFLVQKKPILLLVCMAALLLTGSNFINLFLLFLLLCLFLFRSNGDQKSYILVCLLFLVVFMAKVSPQNNLYVAETFKETFNRDTVHHRAVTGSLLPISQRPDSVLNPNERKIKIATLYLDSLSRIAALKEKKEPALESDKPIIRTETGSITLPQADIHSATYQNIKVPLAAQQPLIRFIHRHNDSLPISRQDTLVHPLPGKALALIQTFRFFVKNPGKILTGEGMGNFSSKLAFRATGLGIAGGFPKKYTYINGDFMQNHLDIYLAFFSKRADYHSLTNSPFSVYDQLPAEYGLLGLFAFGVFYLGFFAKHYKTLTYGLPLLLLIMAVLLVDYWFEQLSVLVLFELLLLLNIKETGLKTFEVHGRA